MASLRSWFRGGSSSTNPAKTPSSGPSPAASQSGLNDSNAGTPSTSQADELEAAEIEDAMAVAGMIMNDDIDGAEALLRERKDPSSFHLLVMGVAAFMKSILGFEKEVMAEASNRLAECETRAWADLKRAQREADKAAGGGSYWYGRAAAAAATGDGAKAGHVFPPGSEFALVHAEAQLMSAVVAIMHESLTDAVRGFYKLRKAFLTLDGIMESEAKALGQLKDGVGGGGGGGAAAGAAASPPKRPRMSEDVMPGSFDETEFAEFEERNGRGSDSDADFVDAAAPSKPASASASRPSTPAVEKAVADLSLTSTSTSTSASQTAASDVSAAGSHGSGSRTPSSVRRLETKAASQPPLAAASSSSALGRVPTSIDPGVFTATRDVFVHSGVNMCFGALLLVISMVPPAFSRLLQIVGFKGDREKGIRMLWQSTKFPNINGAVAGLLVLGYYNGLLTFADILPGDRDVEELAAAEDEGVVGYPKERCLALLADMRARYPASGLWKLEEARVLSSTRRLREAIEVMAGNDTSKMRQVVALNKFELSLNAI
ncbi:hypothetical protein VTK73DRAFT_4354 [Phialemonium thermophilum]|uniref:Inclusion body clearance protein IML2 n=1 Tax=Phialemonium thermophilum TaxID=223376 RepID=A0ABR3V940_9PEZI